MGLSRNDKSNKFLRYAPWGVENHDHDYSSSGIIYEEVAQASTTLEYEPERRY